MAGNSLQQNNAVNAQTTSGPSTGLGITGSWVSGSQISVTNNEWSPDAAAVSRDILEASLASQQMSVDLVGDLGRRSLEAAVGTGNAVLGATSKAYEAAASLNENLTAGLRELNETATESKASSANLKTIVIGGVAALAALAALLFFIFKPKKSA